MRRDGRTAAEHRPFRLERGFLRSAAGSVLISTGNTRVLCSCSIDVGVPPFLVGTGKGWLTAEYSMLPGSTSPRKRRDQGKPDGRSVEIQRLIGRSLRNIMNLNAVGEHTIWLDCDVLDADGGTRTAAITGAFVALVDGIKNSILAPLLKTLITDAVAATSVGIVDGEVMVDLDYSEDSRAGVDMNLVMTGAGQFIEVQGCGERVSFSQDQLQQMLAVGQQTIRSLMDHQRTALAGVWPEGSGR